MTAYLAAMFALYAVAVGFDAAAILAGRRGDMPTMWTRLIAGIGFYFAGLTFLILDMVTS